MSKREKQRESSAGAPLHSMGRPQESSAWLVRIAMLAGLALVVYLSWTALREARAGRAQLDERFARLDGQLAQLATRVDAVARGAAPQRGPDPNRVYTVRTDGSPAKGPATAPIVIAEFSDFQ